MPRYGDYGINEAPEGTGDTHYSIMRGDKKWILLSKQGKRKIISLTLYIIQRRENFWINLNFQCSLSRL